MLSNITPLEHLFKPEVRNAGEELKRKGAVYLKPASDRQIDASLKASTPVRVSMRADSIGSTEFSVDCTCPPSKKGQLCKHIWATILVASEKTPDFFENKTSLTKTDSFAASETAKSSAREAAKSPETLKREDDFKQRQADYRKEAYQKQKERAKSMKAERSGEARSTSKGQIALPDPVKEALKYFELNGFLLTAPADRAAVDNAKRVLSRVFHPDKGGTQEEIIELLEHADVLLKF